MEIAKLFQTEIRKYIDKYIEWRSEHYIQSEDERNMLLNFIHFHKLTRFEDITHNDISSFIDSLSRTNTEYQMKRLNSCINGFLRYHRARGYFCVYFAEVNFIKNMRTNNTGRPPRITEIYKVRELRAKKLSFREIAEKMKEDVGQVYRWYTYPLEKYQNVGLLDGGSYPQK